MRGTDSENNISACTKHPEFKPPPPPPPIQMANGVIYKWPHLWFWCVVSDTLRTELSWWSGGGSCFWSLSPHSWCSKESLAGLKLFSPTTPTPYLVHYLFPPSHLIAFDKGPYWLHIIRCSGGSLRLYYSAHIAQLFSILHGWHTRFCKVQTGPRLRQWSRYTRCRRQTVVDMLSNATANLLEDVKEGKKVKPCSNILWQTQTEFELELIPNLYNSPYFLLVIDEIEVWSSWTLHLFTIWCMWPHV